MSAQQCSFPCSSCQRPIFVPPELPPTQAPCPHCGAKVVSPEPTAGEAQQARENATTPPSAALQTPPLVGPVRVPPPSHATPPPRVSTPPTITPSETESAGGGGMLLNALLALVGLGLVGAIIFFLWKGKEEPKTVELPPSQELAVSSGGTAGSIPSATTRTERVAALLGEPIEYPESHLTRAFQRDGWKKEALEVLATFLRAKSIEERLAVCAPWPTLEQDMRAFHRDYPVDFTDSPVENFSHIPLEPIDTSRGLFSMAYNRPAQFELKEFFRPIPPLKVQMGLEEPELLLTLFGQRENFVMDAVKVQPFFLKAEGQPMKIDWYTFVQARFSLLRDFLENPIPGKKGVFRVFLVQDVTVGAAAKEAGALTYRVYEPADLDIAGRAQVERESAIAVPLSELNWIGMPGKTVSGKTATVELAWEGDTLTISDFICYEFAALGGKTE